MEAAAEMGGAGTRSVAGFWGLGHFQEEARTPAASRQGLWAVPSKEAGHMTRPGTTHPSWAGC